MLFPRGVAFGAIFKLENFFFYMNLTCLFYLVSVAVGAGVFYVSGDVAGFAGYFALIAMIEGECVAG